MFQKRNIKKALKGMSRLERTQGVKDIMSGIKGPITYRGLKKTLAEEGISRVARKRILKEVKTGAVPQQPSLPPQQQPTQEKIAKEGWKIGGKLGEPKSENKTATSAKDAQWIRETGRLGIKFEKGRTVPSLAGQKFQGQSISPEIKSQMTDRASRLSPKQETSQPKTREEITRTSQEKHQEYIRVHEENINTTQQLEQREQEEEARIDSLLSTSGNNQSGTSTANGDSAADTESEK